MYVEETLPYRKHTGNYYFLYKIRKRYFLSNIHHKLFFSSNNNDLRPLFVANDSDKIKEIKSFYVLTFWILIIDTLSYQLVVYHSGFSRLARIAHISLALCFLFRTLYCLSARILLLEGNSFPRNCPGKTDGTRKTRETGWRTMFDRF